MDTNQLLTLMFGDDRVTLEHKTLYGSLTKVLQAANAYRMVDKHGQPVQLASLLSSTGFSQQIALLEQDKQFTLDERGAWFKHGKGRNTDTHAHLMLLLYVAQTVSPRFHYEFNKRIVLGQLCLWRDKSGEAFKDLNTVVALSADKVLGKPSHKEHYITLAKAIKDNVKPDGNDWNTATADQLRARAALEEKLIAFLEADVVRDWEHLKSLASKL